MNSHNELVPRALLINEFQISDSCERRKRKAGLDWPPHVLIGRKVYYRRQSISDWLLQQESLGSGEVDPGKDLDGLAVALRKLEALPEAGLPLNPNRVIAVSRLLDEQGQVIAK